MFVFGWCKFKCFVRISHYIDICTVAMNNIRNILAVSPNQIADILHFIACYLNK